MSLELENDRYKIRMQADNPVYLDGNEAFPDDEISLGLHKLTLGLKDSPEKFQLAITSQDEDMPETEPSYKVKTTAREQNKRLRRTGLVSICLLMLVGLIGYFTLYKTSKNMDVAISQLAQQSQKANARAVFEEKIVSLRDSVYLVAIKKGDSIIGQGTAWVVGDGILATNAHVVEGLLDAYEQSGGALSGVVVSPKSPDHIVHNIIDMEMHPHYRAFFEHQSKTYRLMDDGSEINLTPAYDVALLTVDQPERLASPLDIAPKSDLKNLDSGELLAFIGYPMEDAIGGGVNFQKPTPQVQFGAVTSVTDYFMVGENDARNHLIQHNLPAHGGASGSPVFDLNGNVVALFNAGNVVFVEGHRIATGIGVNFAQRADVLTELMREEVTDIEAERIAFWGERLSQFKTPAEIIFSEWQAEMQSLDYDINNIQKQIINTTLDTYDSDYGMHFWEDKLDVEGMSQLLVIAEPQGDVDLDLAWYDVDDEVVVLDNAGAPYAMIYVDSEDIDWSYMQENKLLIFSTAQSVPFTLTIYSL